MKKLIISIAVILVVVGISMWVIAEYPKSRQASHTSMCISNLMQLDGAKEQAAMESKLSKGAIVSTKNVDLFIKDGTQYVKCPSDPSKTFNTSYSLGRIGSKPLCLINPSSHTL